MIYITPQYQKHGLGSIFLKKIEKQAKKLKALVIVLETDKKATWATNFYKKNNYQILSDEDLTKYPFDKVLEKNKSGVVMFLEKSYKFYYIAQQPICGSKKK